MPPTVEVEANAVMLSPPSGQRKRGGTIGVPVVFVAEVLSPMPVHVTLLPLLVPFTPQFEQALNEALGLVLAGGALESRHVSRLLYMADSSMNGRMATSQFGPQQVQAAGELLEVPPT